jgi:L,D-transpeptidase ErfK/SrfK
LANFTIDFLCLGSWVNLIPNFTRINDTSQMYPLRNIVLASFLVLTLQFSSFAKADELILPPADVDLIGEIRYAEAQHEDTLLDIARRYNLGRDEIVNANPGVDTWLPGEGTRLMLPTRYIIPDVPREGLILNLPEMRLYYFPRPKRSEARRMITHPISIGRMDWKTPLGQSRIVAKQKDPSWRPPKSLQQEAAAEGRALPDLVPAGPENPLGRYAMRLGIPGYLIHSTNKPYGLGMRVSHGCIRMYPEDIEGLFDKVRVNTPVHIIDEPVKLGWLADTLFVEVHPPLEEDLERRADLLRHALNLIHAEREKRPFVLDGAALKRAVEEQLGIPVPISKSGILGTSAY